MIEGHPDDANKPVVFLSVQYPAKALLVRAVQFEQRGSDSVDWGEANGGGPINGELNPRLLRKGCLVDCQEQCRIDAREVDESSLVTKCHAAHTKSVKSSAPGKTLSRTDLHFFP